jgi:tRNA (guanosine-2'-O-)-methyltransferase
MPSPAATPCAAADRACTGCAPTGSRGWTADARTLAAAAVELAEGSVPLTRLEPARERTVVLLGHEHQGVPDDVVEAVDLCVEIPMVGQGASGHRRKAGLA